MITKKKSILPNYVDSLYNPSMITEFSIADVDFAVGYAEGISVGGLVGTEYGGIFLHCITDKRRIVTGYMSESGRMASIGPCADAVRGEIMRISSMDKNAMESFLAGRGLYNPFLDRRCRERVARGDKQLRRNIHWSDFKNGAWMTARHKRQLAHEYERFVTARIYGGSGFARSRLFKRVYQVLSGPYGHIAHYDSNGFYDAQMRDKNSFIRNLGMVRDKSTCYGMRLGNHTAHIIDNDILETLAKIALAYADCTPVD